MTPEILHWGRAVFEHYDLATARTLEVGSLDVNGSLRMFHEADDWLGVDQFAGQGVDIVCNFRDFATAEQYGLIVCTEVIEHDPRPWEVIWQMESLLAPGGTLLLTAPSYHFHRHDYPADFYRYSSEALSALCEWSGLTVMESGYLSGHVGVLDREDLMINFDKATAWVVARKPE